MSILHRVVRWLRSESRHGRRHERWARWLGKSWAKVSYGFRIEPTWLELNRLNITIPGLPDAFAGFRIAHLSDFHCGKRISSSYLHEAVDLAQAQQADLVVLTGDFIHNGYKYIDQVAGIVGKLSAPHGVYAVLGNHDHSVRNALGLRRFRHLHRAVAHGLSRQGIQVLHNETVPLTRGEHTVHLVGVEDLWSRACDLNRAFSSQSTSVPCITLAHNPRTVERLAGRRCDLMLSGHTHGGQVNWSRLGVPARARKHQRMIAGLYQYQRTLVYVNKGIGYGFQFRFGVRPEVAIFTLHPPGTPA
ncbi:MAG TPA: metallophosphoesterase [Gemmataceae bacterium]|nr:metallophosphoesterase [Gemmataceae bacterium]